MGTNKEVQFDLTKEEKQELEELEDELRCVPCELATAIGMSLGVCRDLKEKKIDCDELEQKFYDGEMTLEDLIKEIEPHIEERHKPTFEFLKQKRDLLKLTVKELE